MTFYDLCFFIGVVATVGLLFVLYEKYKAAWLKYEKKIHKYCINWWKNEEVTMVAKIFIGCLLFFFIGFLILTSYHFLLDIYNTKIVFKFLEIGKSKTEPLGIGEVGDSLAVLSFITLIISLIMTIFALRQQSKDLKLTHEEMQANRKEAKEANRLRERSEVLENIRLLANNIKTVQSSKGKIVEYWISDTVKEIIQSNLSQLIESSLEVLVKIIRVNKKGRLVDFAKETIKKNKLQLADKKYINADLSGADLSWADLSFADLSGANLSNANLSKVNLSNARLSVFNNLSEARLYAHRLIANIQEPLKNSADLSGANLLEADLSGANLISTNLSNVNLSNAYLSLASLSGANLFGARLLAANLSEAYLDGSNLLCADLSGAILILTDLSGACLSGANLSEAYLYEANLLRVDDITKEQLIEAKTLYKVKGLNPKIEKEIRELGYGHLIDENPWDYNE